MNSGIPILYETFLIEGDFLYFADYRYNYIGAYSLSYGKIEWIAFLADEKTCQERLFGKMIIHNGWIYLIPLSANAMYAVQVDGQRVKKIELDADIPSTYSKYIEKAKFLSAQVVNESIYLIPTTYAAIVEYKIDSEELVYYTDWVDDLAEKGRKEEVAFFRESLLVDENIYCPLCKCDSVLVFNTVNKNIVLIDVNSQNDGFSGICYDGNHYWLSSRKGNYITRWDAKKNEVLCIKGVWNDDVIFSNVVYYDNKIWPIPMSSPSEIAYIEGDAFITMDNSYSNSGYTACYDSLGIYLSDFRSGKLLLIKEDSISNLTIFLNDALFKHYKVFFSKMYTILNGDCKIVNETEKNKLEEFIELLSTI